MKSKENDVFFLNHCFQKLKKSYPQKSYIIVVCQVDGLINFIGVLGMYPEIEKNTNSLSTVS